MQYQCGNQFEPNKCNSLPRGRRASFWAVTLAAVAVIVLPGARLAGGEDETEEAKRPQPQFTFIDLQKKANEKLDGTIHRYDGNNLAQLPKGEQLLGDVKFNIGDSCIVLHGGGVRDKPKEVKGIQVGIRFPYLHILHGTVQGETRDGGISIEDGTLIAEYRIKYEDQSTEIIPVVYGEDLRDWWDWAGAKPTTRGKVVWTGTNDYAHRLGKRTPLRLFLSTWKNPKPDQKVVKIEYVTTNSRGAPFCVAMTVADHPPSPAEPQRDASATDDNDKR